MSGQGALLAELTEAVVEPLSLRVSDGEGRWTVEIKNVAVPAKGARKASIVTVGACGCGWELRGLNVSHGFSAAGNGLELLFMHVRGHVIEGTLPRFEIERLLDDGWFEGTLVAGRVCCAGACNEVKGPKDPRAAWGDPCATHDGRVFDRAYHWIQHDPETSAKSYQSCLMDPDGRLWHFHCAPEESGWKWSTDGTEEDDDTESETQP